MWCPPCRHTQVQQNGQCPSVILQLDPEHFLDYMKRREEREKEEERQHKEREEEEKAVRQKEQFDIDAARAESCAEALLKEEAEKAAAAESGNKKKKKNKKKKSRTSHGTKEETAEDAEAADEATDDVRVAPASIDYQALLLARLREMDLDPALAKGVCYDLRDVEEAVDAILAKQYAKPFRSTLNPHAAVFVPATSVC